MKSHEREPLQRHLRERVPFGVSNPFTTLASFASGEWVRQVPVEVLQSFQLFCLQRQLECPRKEFECFQVDGDLASQVSAVLAQSAPTPTPTTAVVVAASQPDAPMQVRKRIKFGLPPFVAPASSTKPEFQTTLQPYLTMSSPSPWIWFQNPDFVVVFDAFPKAEFHFLILPKLVGAGDLTEVKDLGIIERMHALANECVEHIKQEHRTNTAFRVGFHARPSLKPLHMHCISEDFDSPAMQSAKHWNSFTRDECWVDVRRVREHLRQPPVAAAADLAPKCPHCPYQPKASAKHAVELLKRHLRTKSCM